MNLNYTQFDIKRIKDICGHGFRSPVFWRPDLQGPDFWGPGPYFRIYSIEM